MEIDCRINRNVVTKFDTQVGLVKIQFKFKDGLCRSHIGVSFPPNFHQTWYI